MRIEKLLNDEWLFHKGDIEVSKPKAKGPTYSQSKTIRKQCGPAAFNYNDKPDAFSHPSGLLSHENWCKVDLPHDYVIDQDLDKNENNSLGYMHYDNAWYRKHFTLPENCEGKRVVLRFDGITGKSIIYLNGCLMTHNYSSYNSFEVDISDVVNYNEENVIAIYVNTDEWEGWWYQGGGIYRNVWLTITDPVAIDLWGVYCPYEKINDTQWKVNFETTVLNTEFEDCFVKAESNIFDNEGNSVLLAFGEAAVGSREKSVVKYSGIVSNPLLWDCDNPNLYTVKTILYKNGEAIDENYTRIGFRTIEISLENGFLINGEKSWIHGVCCHQDFGLTGLAVPDNIAKYKIKLIKEMGANGYRTSHYQHTAAYLDACDELGIFVLDEVRWFESTDEGIKQLESLLKRDRNRPSVIMWSTSNEETSHVTDLGKRVHRAMAAHIRKFDKSRPITVAQSRTPESSVVFDDCDVIGINYNIQKFDAVHELYPNKPIFSSEDCATGTSRDWHLSNEVDGRLLDKDQAANRMWGAREATIKTFKEKDYIFGSFQWIAVEHRGEAVWPAISSKSGAFDLFLQKKGAFYQNKSNWTDEPMAHIVPHWNFRGLEGEPICVIVYTNCDELELFLNGESQGRKKIERYGHGEWDVPYSKGELKVLGYRKGEIVCEDIRRTTGRPYSLRLTLDNDFEVNGRDLALFTCECLDEDGNVVPDASEFVRFTTERPAKIIGTGSDHCDHNSVAIPERRMYMGKIRIAVKPDLEQKELILTAFSDNCGIARFRVNL